MIFRIRYLLRGGHYHCRFFAGDSEGKLGKCGDFCMRKEEFDIFRSAATFVQFMEEEIRQ